MKMLKAPPSSETSPEDSPKTVVVTVRMDQQSWQLLTWTLVKVATPSDHVIALHVATAPAAADPDALFAVIKEFEAVITVYEAFCNLKQIDLKLKVCCGGSIRKTLIAETKSLATSALILGIAKAAHHLRTSIANHCAKKLPATCSVLAVHNGKIAFQRGAAAAAAPPPSGSVNSASADAHTILTSLEASRNRNSTELEASTSLLPELREVSPGWPLFRRAMLSNQRSVSQERSKMLVVQWAMRLPSRYSASPVVHPDTKAYNACSRVR